MSYVDAGYVIALATLALYSVSLLARRRRLERAAGRHAQGAPGGAESGGSPASGVRARDPGR